MMLKEQVLAFRRKEPIWIMTPVGLIEIHQTADHRKLRIILPNATCRAFVGDKQDLKDQANALVSDGKPKFDLLAPVTNEAGEMIGVVIPEVLKLREEPKDVTEPVPPVADSESSDSGRHSPDGV